VLGAEARVSYVKWDRSPENIFDDFVDAAAGGLESFLLSTKARAKAKAPIRKVFASKGGLRKEVRTFRDSTGRVTSTTVRTSRYNRLSTSQEARQAFLPRGDFSNPNAYRGGTALVGEGRKTGVEVQFGLYGQLSYRGRDALARGLAAYGSGYKGRGDTSVIRVKNNAGLKALGLTARQRAAADPYHAGNIFGQHYVLQLGGKLRESIDHDTHMDGPKLRGFVFTHVFYARYQEFGTQNGHTPAHPFMRPALFEGEKKFQKAIAGRVRREFGG
jgi:HK97 gp10 family phage protein